MDYDAFYQACLPKMRALKDEVSKEHFYDVTPVAVTLYKLVYAVSDPKGARLAVTLDHDGTNLRVLFNHKPVDLGLLVEHMTTLYYDQLSKRAALRAQEAEERLNQREQQTKLDHLPLFKTIVKELYGLDWYADGWTLQLRPHVIELYKEGRLTVEMPIGWLSMSQEETSDILRVSRRCNPQLNSLFQLPKSLTVAWIDLERVSYTAHFHAMPEIFAWIDDQSVPHACVLGVTASGREGQPLIEVSKILAEKIAEGMPYDTRVQPRMLDALIQICREQKDDYVNTVVNLIWNEATRESTREQLLKIRSDKTPWDH